MSKLEKHLIEIEKTINKFGPNWNLFGQLDKLKYQIKQAREEVENLKPN
jgi:hypothetical protein